MASWVVPGYTEVKDLGAGGAGRVVLAVHEPTGTKVAIKYVADNLVSESGFMGDFRSEAEVLATVESPHVTQLYEYLESAEHAAIVMELVEGVSLRALLREKGPLEPEAALAVLKGSLQGLATTHRRGIVHRDFKPANVLVDTSGHSKLADFGLATRSGRVGIVAGTPSYMPPEQWAGEPATPQTDIYAATATFYECLTGGPPFRIREVADVLRLQYDKPDVPVERTPEAVHGLLRWGLAADPADRPSNANDFLRELEKAAGAGYGKDWERKGWQQLARRVALLAFLLPDPPTRPSVTTSFAWTRLGRPAMTLVAMIILIGVLLVGGVAVADQATATKTLADAAVVLPPTVVGGSSPAPLPAPSPSPSTSPSPSASPSATPTATPTSTHPHTVTPKPPTHTPTTSPSPSPSAPPPTPTISALAIQGDAVSGLCGADKCTLVEWTATIRASGSGPAVLQVGLYPISANGSKSPVASASWNVPFQVTQPSMTFPESASRSKEINAACQQQFQLAVDATVTVNGTVVKSMSATPLNCPEIIS